MTWFDKQARARRRAEQDRNALAASVEEVVAESKMVVDEWHDNNEEQEIVAHVSTSGTAIIPPLLRLQTRPVPAVDIIQTPPPSKSGLTATGPVEVPRVIEQGQRLAGRSTRVHLQAVRSGLAEEIFTEHMAAVENIPLKGQTGSISRVGPASQSRPMTGSASPGQTGSMPKIVPGEGQTGSIPRVGSAGQSRPMTGSASPGQTGSMPKIVPGEGKAGSIPQVGPAGQSRTASSAFPARNGATQSSSTAPPQPNLRLPGGSGVIKQGQNVITVPNTVITERSVVTVMLAGNPGPVVIQYVALHPRMGFTVHLSAPTAASTPFNYLIWPF